MYVVIMNSAAAYLDCPRS